MKKNQKKQEGMWDILIPVLLVIAVMPWVVHLAVYSCGYADYEWYSSNDVIADFYCYYKSYFLDLIGIFAGLILVFRMALYKEKTKNMKAYLPLGIYCLLVVCSTVFSVNRQASVRGNFESFESCIVLIAYVVLSVYAYQIMEYERDYRVIWRAVFGISLFFLIIGTFQMFQCDLMNFEWVQRLLMSKEDFELYGGEIKDTFSGNNVYLTLYNPNYAGIALNMLFAVVFTVFVTETQKWRELVYGILSLGLVILVWFTYSRASLAVLVLTLILTLFFQWKEIRDKLTVQKIFCAAAGVLFLTALLIGLDASWNFKFLSRMIDRNDREPLESMTTEEDGVHIRYAGADYLVWMEDGQAFCRNEADRKTESAGEGEELSLPMETGAKAMYFEEDEPKLLLYLAETTLKFVKENDGYYYEHESGKRSRMVRVEAADFHGLEYLGSARGYIWSRVMPLLYRYLIVGSGPDTFPEVFPQNDYAGKMVYSDNPEMVIEKAHSDYLTKWVQTGFLSVICILIFYAYLIKRGMETYRKRKTADMSFRIGFGCYLACISYMAANLFNDSTLQTSPMFWVFSGIALGGMKKTDADRKDF